MKKYLILLVLSFTFILYGCSSGVKVETMKGWMFQYNKGNSDYSLFFGLCDKSDRDTSADCTVSIKIVNANNETVFEGTKDITTDDFGNYSSVLAGERFLANVRIDENEISPGSSVDGTVYFTVDGENFHFDEANCDAYSCLPVKDVELVVDTLPVDLKMEGIWGGVEGSYTITDVQYSVDTSLASPHMIITVSGEKTGGKSGSFSYDMINYKLYDSNEYLVDSGMLSLGAGLSKGDKFKTDSNYIYDVVPGETYTLVLTDYEY